MSIYTHVYVSHICKAWRYKGNSSKRREGPMMCQLESNSSHWLPREHQVRKCLHQIGPKASLRGHFPDWWLMWKGPAQHGQCHPLASVRKLAGKPWRATQRAVYLCVLRFGSCLQFLPWFPLWWAMISMISKQDKPFPSQWTPENTQNNYSEQALF